MDLITTEQRRIAGIVEGMLNDMERWEGGDKIIFGSKTHDFKVVVQKCAVIVTVSNVTFGLWADSSCAAMPWYLPTLMVGCTEAFSQLSQRVDSQLLLTVFRLVSGIIPRIEEGGRAVRIETAVHSLRVPVMNVVFSNARA